MAVADGMGGHQGGATASRMAVELLARELARRARRLRGRAAEQQREISVRTTEEMPAVERADRRRSRRRIARSPRSEAATAAGGARSCSRRRSS